MNECNECGIETEDIVECHECGFFCVPCYDKSPDDWVILDQPNHCRDLCPEHAYMAKENPKYYWHYCHECTKVTPYGAVKCDCA